MTNFSNFSTLARLNEAKFQIEVGAPTFNMAENLAHLEKNENLKYYSKQTSK